MIGLLYFLIALLATTAGSMTGMGGGVMIKPLLDFMGQFDAGSINMLSSITVLAMSVVSVGRQAVKRVPIHLRIAIPLAVGAIVGGNLGQRMLEALLRGLDNRNGSAIVQNLLLALLIAAVILYMKNKHRIRPLGLTGVGPAALAGLALGLCSSFLGIGGGPFNVALLIYLFDFDTHTATVNSLLIILFSQIAKVLAAASTTGFEGYDLSILPLMAVGAILGGFIGPAISHRLPEKNLDRAFNAVQYFVLLLCVVNLVKLVIL